MEGQKHHWKIDVEERVIYEDAEKGEDLRHSEGMEGEGQVHWCQVCRQSYQFLIILLIYPNNYQKE